MDWIVLVWQFRQQRTSHAVIKGSFQTRKRKKGRFTSRNGLDTTFLNQSNALHVSFSCLYGIIIYVDATNIFNQLQPSNFGKLHCFINLLVYTMVYLGIGVDKIIGLKEYKIKIGGEEGNHYKIQETKLSLVSFPFLLSLPSI